MKNHYDICLNKIAIESLQFEDSAIPTETNFKDFYRDNNNDYDFDNTLKKISSDFKEDDISKYIFF